MKSKEPGTQGQAVTQEVLSPINGKCRMEAATGPGCRMERRVCAGAGDCRTALQVCLLPLNQARANGWDEQLYVNMRYTQKLF